MRNILIIFTLLFSPFLAANPLPNAPHIYVEGSAEIDVSPDIVTINVGLDAIGENPELVKKELDLKTMKIVAEALNLGVPREQITSDSIRINRELEWKDNKRHHVGSRASRSIRVEIKDLESYDKVHSSLISMKLSENISSKLSLSDERVYTDKALSSALQDAFERAEMLAKIQGKKVKSVYSISEFNLRLIERQHLNLSREVVGSFSELDIRAADISAFASDQNIADALGRVTGVSIFEPGTMVAKAQVFVVYIIK